MQETVRFYDSILMVINDVKRAAHHQETYTKEEQERKDYYIKGLETTIRLIELVQEFTYSEEFTYDNLVEEVIKEKLGNLFESL
ncbi:hypothetical protein [Paenibacillus illinoisensis]|uniref:Uncharacterized protein n=1 Tax=Paenibacillus illinoisensis TaxID=59845 RepID=A0A2W0C6W3_9BACL|nr:hypothetical protein [Paenibacillus illinoisensis]PYY28190.1 hypothetical protein PIL02S_03336 [Paenibacillus illinoisensis]